MIKIEQPSLVCIACIHNQNIEIHGLIQGIVIDPWGKELLLINLKREGGFLIPMEP